MTASAVPNAPAPAMTTRSKSLTTRGPFGRRRPPARRPRRAASARGREDLDRGEGRRRAARIRPRRSSRRCRCKVLAAARRRARSRSRQSAVSRERTDSFAATPPATTSAVGEASTASRKISRAARVRSSTTSTAAAWNEAARSATSLLRERRVRFRGDAKRRLQPGEGKVAAGRAVQRTRQRKALWVSRLRRPLDVRPAGIGEAQKLGGLVEGFAERVVDGRAEAPIAADAFDRDELRVPAGDEQQKIGKAQRRR